MYTKLLILALLRHLHAINNSPSPNCNYRQSLEEGESYSVYNPHHPNEYEGENHCEWITQSNRLMDVNCSLNLPESYDCTQDSLTLQGLFGPAKKYCGSGNIILQEYGQVNIALDTPYDSQGGQFTCDIKTSKDEDDDDDEIKKCHCGWTNPEKIAGGEETGVNEYPMMAGLIDVSDRIVYCGAAIINSRQLITAASCLEDRDERSIVVVVGDHDVNIGSDTEATEVFVIDSSEIHPHRSGKYHDIAVITISGTIEFNDKVGPICLPFEHAPDSFAGQFVDVLGWGTLEFAGEQPTALQKIEVSVITNYECTKTYRDIQEFQMCTFTEGKDACQYDAGGPLLWRNAVTKRLVLVGIINYGACADDRPAVNTRIGAYIDWIVSVSPPDVKYCIEE